MIPLAARRIVFGKFLNCGQTCVAPDYVLCDSRIHRQLVDAIVREIIRQYGSDPLKNAAYGRIVNEKHFERLCDLMKSGTTVHGGGADPHTLQIEPTVLDAVSWTDAVMQEEIFGPLLPILTYDRPEDIFRLLSGRQKPLALYIFSEDKQHIRAVTQQLSFGGGCVNDTIIHLATSKMGFGGVGESGMGTYHGKAGFEAFSHRKSIVDKKTWMDLPMRYQPYTHRFYGKLLHFFLK